MFWPVKIILDFGMRPDTTIEEINRLVDAFLETLFQEGYDNPECDISKRHFCLEAARQQAILHKIDQHPA